MTPTSPATKPKLTPEVQQRLCKVADWVLDGASREEVISRTMTEWQLERRQAQKYLRRVNDRLRSDADECDLQFSLHVIQHQRMRVIRETREVMQDKEADSAKINHALRHLTAMTRILSDYEKTALARERPLELPNKDRASAEAAPTSLPPKASPADKQVPRPEVRKTSPAAAPTGQAQPAVINSAPPAPVSKKQLRHRPPEMKDKEFTDYLTRLEAATPAPALVICPSPNKHKT